MSYLCDECRYSGINDKPCSDYLECSSDGSCLNCAHGEVCHRSETPSQELERLRGLVDQAAAVITGIACGELGVANVGGQIHLLDANGIDFEVLPGEFYTSVYDDEEE